MRKTWTIGAVALLAGILMMPNYQAVARRGGGGFHGGGGGFHGGSPEEVSGAVGLAASAAVDLVVSADSVVASDVSAVVDSDVVSDSTVGMVGVITPTTTDAIIRVWTHDMAEELEHWQMDASPYRSQSESLGMC